MLQRLIVLAAILALTCPCTVWAGSKAIESEYTYVMGENDTRAQARRLCFLEAKRQAVEQAGTYVESATEVTELMLSRDEVSTFASAFVEAHLVSEEFVVNGGTFAVKCKVRVDVDTETLGRRLVEFSADPTRKKRLGNLADRIKQLEERAGVDSDSSLATARGRTLPSLEELEREKARLRAEVQRLGQAARRVVEPGMTKADVQQLLGPPRVKKLNDKMTSTYECHNYGEIWVVYKDGLVACTRKRLAYRNDYRSDCHCAGMAGEVFTQ
ncbi:hypothetical protein [Desulfovibrio ferrophilus]|uniref:Uncharacterized protein n=1 Tax=Desulfovibrio ferrophilus TaxID=241368 RepID=A0A2Z6AUH6_9BACT|nr:hypothetical protein [Desulfovibrio ferrophilus]BBD06884.1 uncharacterized protein DFE_0158 [Desulfovibrio ferrophilus]